MEDHLQRRGHGRHATVARGRDDGRGTSVVVALSIEASALYSSGILLGGNSFDRRNSQVILAGKFGLGDFHDGRGPGALKFIHSDGLA